VPPPLAPDVGDGDWDSKWGSVRDANIRPYVDWRPGQPVTLPVLTARPQGGAGGGGGGQPQAFGGHQGRHPGHNGGPDGRGGPDGGRGGRRRRRRGRQQQRQGRDHHRHSRDRDRGPRLPGVYNPGGD
jgi:hypothetical protein